jgi:menaquinone-dependent protoporphyrinogen oxidase
MKFLVAYSTVHGSTREVALFIQRVLETYNAEVTVADVSEVSNIADYDAFILGSAIHSGMWLHPMSQFMEQFRDQIAAKPAYLFVTCIRILEEAGYQHVMQYYLHHKTLEDLNISNVVAFTGRLQIDAIDFNERWTLGLQYDGTQPPTQFDHDYRNWQEIAAWTNKIAKTHNLTPQFEKAVKV